MMINRFCLLFTGFVVILSSALGEEGAQQKEWRKSLGSGDFKTRSSAMAEIWGEGSAALPFLENLIEGNDPELGARASSIAHKVKLGITPDTPEKIVKLIDEYFEAPVNLKIMVLNQLLEAEENEILLQLGRSEEDPVVMDRLDVIMVEILPGLVKGYLEEGKMEVAKDTLALSRQFPHLIQYAHLLDRMGELDAEIERLSEAESSDDQARYLACLRVKGDAATLRKAAEKLGDYDAEVVAALTMGDHVPYLESLLERGDPALSIRHYVNWTLASHRGDEVAQKEAYEALVYLSGLASEQGRARLSLLRMGYGEVVLEGLDRSEFTSRLGYLLGQEDYAAAQKEIGLPDGDGGEYEEWLKDLGIKARKEIKETGEGGEVLDHLVAAIEFLEDRGLVERATQGALLLFDLVRPAKELDASAYTQQIYFTAPVSTYTAIAREIDEHEASLGQFLARFGSSIRGDESVWLDGRLKKMYPEMTTRERLFLTMSFSARRLYVEARHFEEARDRLIGLIMKEDDRVGSLTNLIVLFHVRNREEDLLKVTAALREADRADYRYEALIAIDAGDVQKGAGLLSGADKTALSDIPELLYQEALVLKRAGVEGGDELLERALLLSDGGVLSLQSFAMEHLRHGELNEAYEFMCKALLRSEDPRGSGERFVLRHRIIEELGTEAVALGKWQEVLAYREVSALYSPYASVGGGVMVMRPRFQILIARGAVAMQRGDRAGAVKSFSRAHEILPRDGYLANDLFPLLRELGLKELHDQLYSKTARSCRENIRLYPKDDNAYNCFAWLASRANRDLDEAEEYLKLALKLNPQSAAYLDTMGEIYFARRNRDEAVAWSNRCVENGVLGSRSRWELQGQNRRFKSGKFPVR